MLDFYVIANESEIAQFSLRPRVSVGGATYWFLHRYFVQADLNPGDYSFLNFYEDTELQGYQLHRLKTELELARLDLSTRVGGVRVLAGWLGETKSLESEDWKMAQAEELTQTVSQLLELVAEAQAQDKLLFAMGD